MDLSAGLWIQSTKLLPRERQAPPTGAELTWLDTPMTYGASEGWSVCPTMEDIEDV